MPSCGRNLKTVPQTIPYPKKNYSLLHSNPSSLNADFHHHKILQKSRSSPDGHFSNSCVPSTQLGFYSPFTPKSPKLLLLSPLLHLSCWPPNFLKLYSSLGFSDTCLLVFLRRLCSRRIIFAGRFSS